MQVDVKNVLVFRKHILYKQESEEDMHLTAGVK